MNVITLHDPLTKLVYASVLAGLILAFAHPARLPHAGPDAAAPAARVAH
jgi:hypothetical protein